MNTGAQPLRHTPLQHSTAQRRDGPQGHRLLARAGVAAAMTICISVVLNAARPETTAVPATNAAEPKVSAQEASLLQKANDLAQTDLQAAIAVIEGALYPDINPAVLFSLGCLYAQNGQVAHAENLFAITVNRVPGFSRARHNLATVLAQQGKIPEAVRELRHLLRLQPSRHQARRDLANAYRRQRKYAQAEAELRTLLDNGFETCEVNRLLADIVLEQGRTQEAEPLLRKALEEKPEDEPARRALVHVLLELGHQESAARELEALVRNNPELAGARRELTNLLVGIGKTDEAIAHLKEGLRLEPEDRQAGMMLASLLAETGLHDAARTELEALIAADPEHLDARDALVKILLATDSREQAVKELRELLHRAPEQHVARLMLAELLLSQEQFSDAAKELACLLDRGAPGRGKTLRLLGYALRSAGQPLAGEAAYRAALTHEPDSEEIRLGLIGCLLDRSDWAMACPLLRQELAHAHLRPTLWELLANAHLEQEHRFDALVTLECARRLGLDSDESGLALADLYAEHGFCTLAAQRYVDAFGKGETPPVERILAATNDLARAGKTEEANALLTGLAGRGPELSPEQGQRLQLLRARIALAKGDKVEGARLYEQALSRDPLAPEALLQSGNLLRKMGKLDEAQVRFESLARTSAKHRPVALLRQAQIAVEGDEYQRAVELLESSLELRYQAHVERYLEQVRRMIR